RQNFLAKTRGSRRDFEEFGEVSSVSREASSIRPFGKSGVRTLVAAAALGLASAPLPVARAQQNAAAVAPHHAPQMGQGLHLFKERVRPLLIAQCLDCHGGKAKKGDFDLSDRKPLIDSGVIDGGARASRLYSLITHADEPHMPSKKPKLPAADIEIIARWI